MNPKHIQNLRYRDLEILELAISTPSTHMFCYGPSFDALDKAALLDDEPIPRPTPMAKRLLAYLRYKGLYGAN